MTPLTKTYISKSKAGHYTVTIKKLSPWGTWNTAFKQNHIDNADWAREIAASAKAELEKS